jgi:hypothetical protein
MYEMKREPDGTYVFSVPNGRYVLPGKSESEAYRFRRETIAFWESRRYAVIVRQGDYRTMVKLNCSHWRPVVTGYTKGPGQERMTCGRCYNATLKRLEQEDGIERGGK